MNPNTQLALKEYGLSDKEVEIYTALLPLGSINLQEIAKRVSLPRTTIYNTLNYLASKGLVSKIIRGHVTFFEAIEPKKLINDIEQKKSLILSALPELENLKKQIKESSSVEIYEGFKGISTILAEVFRKKQQTFYFGSYSKSLEVLKHLPEHAANIRLINKIPAKVIIERFKEPRFHERDYKKITELRFLESLKDFPCMIFIFGEKVAIYTLEGDLVGIIIKNKEVSRAMKIIFDLYWKISKS
jgi:sugar-specific transcriptional regulator TrmB